MWYCRFAMVAVEGRGAADVRGSGLGMPYRLVLLSLRGGWVPLGMCFHVIWRRLNSESMSSPKYFSRGGFAASADLPTMDHAGLRF